MIALCPGHHVEIRGIGTHRVDGADQDHLNVRPPNPDNLIL